MITTIIETCLITVYLIFSWPNWYWLDYKCMFFGCLYHADAYVDDISWYSPIFYKKIPYISHISPIFLFKIIPIWSGGLWGLRFIFDWRIQHLPLISGYNKNIISENAWEPSILTWARGLLKTFFCFVLFY